MRVIRDEPFEAQGPANRRMAVVLQRATLVALVVALAGVAVPGAAGEGIAWVAFGLVIAVPLGRICWLAARWASRREWLFSLLAVALVVIVSVGGVLALAQG